jgi:phytoene synthase
MALLMGTREPAALARACDLGVAMQLSNIARDVGEDAAMGRLYLPRQWMREAGLDPDAWLARPQHSPALAGVVQRLLEAADALYERVGAGVAELPLACRPGINAARYLYAEIGHEVKRRGLDPLAGRAVVSRRRKLVGLARAMLALRPRKDWVPPPPLPANAFLVHAVQAWPPGVQPLPWWSVKARLVRTIELFTMLERRERSRFAGSSP